MRKSIGKYLKKCYLQNYWQLDFYQIFGKNILILQVIGLSIREPDNIIERNSINPLMLTAGSLTIYAKTWEESKP